jgi:hypothetical protein
MVEKRVLRLATEESGRERATVTNCFALGTFAEVMAQTFVKTLRFLGG